MLPGAADEAHSPPWLFEAYVCATTHCTYIQCSGILTVAGKPDEVWPPKAAELPMLGIARSVSQHCEGPLADKTVSRKRWHHIRPDPGHKNSLQEHETLRQPTPPKKTRGYPSLPGCTRTSNTHEDHQPSVCPNRSGSWVPTWVC
eukprot:3209287-Pyramimonas_sp.AAC.1